VVGCGEHGDEDAEPERSADLLGDVDDAARVAGVLGCDARDPGEVIGARQPPCPIPIRIIGSATAGRYGEWRSDRAGLLLREVDVWDRRRRRLSLTPASSRRLRAGDQAERDVLGVLDDGDAAAVRAAMERVYETLRPPSGCAPVTHYAAASSGTMAIRSRAVRLLRPPLAHAASTGPTRESRPATVRRNLLPRAVQLDDSTSETQASDRVGDRLDFQSSPAGAWVAESDLFLRSNEGDPLFSK
jgi:hypothetical protein